MEENGLSPAKIAVLAVILALFAGAGYVATRSGSSDSSKVAATAAASPVTASVDATQIASAGGAPAANSSAQQMTGSASPADNGNSAPPPAANVTAAPVPAADQAVPAPSQVMPPPQQTASAQSMTPETAAATPAAADSSAASDRVSTRTEAAASASAGEVAQNPPDRSAESSEQFSQQTGHHKSASRSKSHGRAPPSALTVLTPWWREGTSDFQVVAVGPASEKTGIVVVFSTDLKDPAAAAQQLHLRRDGKAVDGTWQTGANNRVLALTDITPGKYQLAIDGAVAGTSSQTLGNTKVGPVYVR